jgi:hypothetical protein
MEIVERKKVGIVEQEEAKVVEKEKVDIDNVDGEDQVEE